MAAVEAAGQKSLPLKLDLAELASINEAMDHLVNEWGGVDLVVNNGRHIGPGLTDNVLETPIEQYSLFLTAHGVAPIRITQKLLPSMLERGRGTFITISSGAGYEFYPKSSRPGHRYRSGKAAGHTLAGSIQAEYGDNGIGFAVARALGALGLSVLVGARDPKRGQHAADQLLGESIEAAFVHVDLTDEASARRAEEEVVRIGLTTRLCELDSTLPVWSPFTVTSAGLGRVRRWKVGVTAGGAGSPGTPTR